VAIQLAKVVPTMFPGIYDALLRDLNPSISEEHWRRLFEWPWENPEDHVGYALLEDDGSVVGYAGTIYSHQEIRGRMEAFCNVTTWVVKEPYRSGAVSLIMPTLLRRDLTITNLTPIPGVSEIFSRLGFKVLESHRRVIFPRPWWFFRRQREFKVSVGTSEVEPSLSLAQRQVMRDHAPLCEHLVVNTVDGEECYLIFKRVRTLKLPAARIYHISNPTVFLRALPTLQTEFMKMGHPVLVCDARLVDNKPIPWSRRISIPHSRLFRSATLGPADIPNIYSELVLLGI